MEEQLNKLLTELAKHKERGVATDLVVYWLHKSLYPDEIPTEIVEASKTAPLSSPIMAIPSHMPQSYALIEEAIKRGLVEKKVRPGNPEMLASAQKVLSLTELGEQATKTESVE